jgi:hypothetical protein
MNQKFPVLSWAAVRRPLMAAAVALGVGLPVTPAHAICPEARTIYEISKPTKASLLTNLRGDWAEAGFTATYNKTTTGSVNASMTATVSAEAGVVFAKASTSLGVTVGGSWSKADSWSYSKQVPQGKEGRIVMYRESRSFTVTKKSLRAPCNYVAVYSERVNAPLTKGANIWRMQLRKPGTLAKGAAPGSEESYEEIDVAIEQDK